MNRLKDKYINEVQESLRAEYGIKNKHALPKVEKVVLSVGLGEAKDDQGVLDKVIQYFTAISGQKPVTTFAKKSISAFKVAKGQSVGVMVTLRREKMYFFLDKLINIVLPKVRDFRGVSESAFDSRGNLNLGIREQIIFPEVDYKTVDKTRGLGVTIVTTSTDIKQGKKLLELLGMPFKQSLPTAGAEGGS